MKELYKAEVNVTGGRDGKAVSSDGQLNVVMALPKAIGGSGAGTNPEQLFAAGFAGCFTSSIKFAASQKKLDAGEVSVDADVVMGLTDAGTYGLKAKLAVSVPGLAGGDLDAVIAEAKRICAYTNATRGNVETIYVINGR
jgi:lipoyl-dependent peroxiredoxin